MRAALLIVLGLAIGIIGTVFTMNALQARANPLPHSVMHLMDYHADVLRDAIKSKQCGTPAVQSNLASLQTVSHDIGPAFAGAEPDFFKAADKLHGAIDSAVKAAPTDCPTLMAALKPVGQACKSCHQQYR